MSRPTEIMFVASATSTRSVFCQNSNASLRFAAAMGFLGGLLPAWRAARLPITMALRES